MLSHTNHYEKCLNGIWDFKAQTDENWTQVNVPGVYTGPSKSWGGEHWDCFDYPSEWEGKGGVYRRTFDLPIEMSGKDIRFYCGACAHHSEVFLNGEKVGEWHDGYTPMEFSLTSAVKSGENLLEIHVSSQKNDLFDDYGTDRRGIWQDCWLREFPELCVENDLFVKTSCKGQNICCDIPVSNLSEETKTFCIECVVSELDGVEVKRFKSENFKLDSDSQSIFTVEENWIDPHLWFPHDPHLYYLNVLLVDDNGNIVDNRRERFGFREISWEGPHLFINEQELFLRGHGGHYFGDIQGTREYMEAWLGEMKKLGVNFMRLHDSPKHKELYDVADEIGIMLESEAVCHFKVPENPVIWKNHLERLVKAQRNRPSIIMWSVSNELRWRGGGEKPEMIQWVKTFDLTRPVFASDFSLESRHGDICAHHYNPITVFDEWEQYGPDKPMIWDELGSVWQHDRPLDNGTSGYELQAQDYATGLWHDGHDQILHDIEYNREGKVFNGELHRVNGFCPWDLAYIFFRWQPTNNNSLLELHHDDSETPGIKLSHIKPGASPINAWDPSLPVFEKNPGYYLFEKYIKEVRFFDDNSCRTFFGSRKLSVNSRIFYDDTRCADSIACLVEKEDGQVLWKNIIELSVIPGMIIDNVRFEFEFPDVSGVTPVNLVREFCLNGERGYRDVMQAKIFPIGDTCSARIFLDNVDETVKTHLFDLGAEPVSDINQCDFVVSEDGSFMDNPQLSSYINLGGKVLCLSKENSDKMMSVSYISDSFSSSTGNISENGISSEDGCKWYGYSPVREVKIFQKAFGLAGDNGRLDFSETTKSGAYAYALFEKQLSYINEGELSLTWMHEVPNWGIRLKKEPDLFKRNIRPMLLDSKKQWYICRQTVDINHNNGQINLSFADTQWDAVENLENGQLEGELKIKGKAQPNFERIFGAGIYNDTVPASPLEFWFSKIEWKGRAVPAALIPLNGADHRLLSGLGQEDFSFWRNNSTSRILDIPKNGNIRNILAGNKDGLGSALYEQFLGKGIALATSLRLNEANEPAAVWMMHNIFEYLKGYESAIQGRTCLLAQGRNKDFFTEIGLYANEDISALENAENLILDASSEEFMNQALKHAEAICSFAEAGGQVLIYKTNEQTIDAVRELTGLDLALTDPFLGERNHCVKAAASWTHSDTPVRYAEYYEGILCHQPFEPNYSPLISGIVNHDLFWDGEKMFEQGIELKGFDPVRPSNDYAILISNWRIDWSKPSWGGEYIHAGKDMRRADWFINRDPVLLQVKKGDGQFVFCQLDLDSGKEKGHRLTRQILSNFGCSLQQNTWFTAEQYHFDFSSRDDQLIRFEKHYRKLPAVERPYYGTPEHLANPKQILYGNSKIGTCLIGDGFTLQYFPFAVEIMWDTHRVTNVSIGNSRDSIEIINVDELLERHQIIQFSCGLEDLKLDQDNEPLVSLDEFTANLETIVSKLKQTNAKLYWTTIIPIPEEVKGYAGDKVSFYNEAAQKIMDDNDVYTNDLNRFVRENFPEFIKGNTLDFNLEQLSAIGKQVAEGILFFGAQ